MQSLRIIYASTSGHTEYVVDTLIAHWKEKEKSLTIRKQRAEETEPEDLIKGDVLIFGSGTWNTGNVEGQLNPHMHDLVYKRAKDMNLTGRSCAIVALGDERYYYTARANEHLATFILKHGGKQLLPPLTIINEPYGQNERIARWADELLKKMKTLPPPASAIE